jgi:hypothetical protein
MTTGNGPFSLAAPHARVGRLMNQVQAEYNEMPGLSITLRQAQRLWAVDRVTCEEALMRLTASGVLRMTAKGRFVRV